MLAACGQATAGSGDGSASEESAAAFEAELIQTMIDREEAVFRPGKVTLAELFPAAGQSEVLADAFRADVLNVEVGRTFTNNVYENYEVVGPVHEVPFDDPRADWRSFEVRVTYDPAITPVLWNGAFLSPVDGDQVPWPVLSEAAGSSGASVVSHFDTLSELRQIQSHL